MTKPHQHDSVSQRNEEWFIAKEGKKLGPFDLKQMKFLAAEGTLQPHDMVLLRSGGTWSSAGKVLEIGFDKLPRQHVPPENAPESSSEDSHSELPQSKWEELKQLATSHYRLNGIILVELVVAGIVAAVTAGLEQPIIGQVVLIPVVLAFGAATLTAVFQLAKRLGHSPWPVTALAFFLFPAVWLYLDFRARRALGHAGVRTRMLGASLPASPPPNFRGGRLVPVTETSLKVWSRRMLFIAIAALPVWLVVYANADVDRGEQRDLLFVIARGVLALSAVCWLSWFVLTITRIVRHYRR